MSEPCSVPGCQTTVRHEHRKQQWTIASDTFWYELRPDDVRMLNEARAVHDLPLLVFGQDPLPSPEHREEPQA
jgi:hypothetical protein